MSLTYEPSPESSQDLTTYKVLVLFLERHGQNAALTVLCVVYCSLQGPSPHQSCLLVTTPSAPSLHARFIVRKDHAIGLPLTALQGF